MSNFVIDGVTAFQNEQQKLDKASVPVALNGTTYAPLKQSAFGLLAAGICGKATGGTNTTLVDTGKNFGTDTLNGKLIRIIIGTVEYIRAISDTDTSTLTIAALATDVVPAVGSEYEVLI